MPERTSQSTAAPDTQANLAKFDHPGLEHWRLRRHLLDTRGLLKEEVDCLLKVAALCKHNHASETTPLALLSGKTVAHIFYENSTRTRSSFEMAARRLGASVLNLDTKVSSVSKGETITDTARQLVAMRVDAIVQRHSASGAADLVAAESGDKVHVVNAGDGWHAHPTQALLDFFTMNSLRGTMSGARVAIVGDILHSRVARSNIWLLTAAGVDVNIAGPPTLMPSGLEKFGVTVHNQIEPAIEGCDFIMVLRLQMERQKQGLIPGIGEYKKLFRLDEARLQLAKPEARILHPGPVNRGIEITDDLVDDCKRSLIAEQVANGVAVRMAVLYLLLSGKENNR